MSSFVLFSFFFFTRLHVPGNEDIYWFCFSFGGVFPCRKHRQKMAWSLSPIESPCRLGSHSAPFSTFSISSSTILLPSADKWTPTLEKQKKKNTQLFSSYPDKPPLTTKITCQLKLEEFHMVRNYNQKWKTEPW